MTERMNISIPEDLKKRMDRFDEAVNWSQVAAHAFEARLEEGAVSAADSEWRFNPSNLCLEFHHNGRWMYEIDLEECKTSAEVLDWVFQISQKTWASPGIVHSMLAALSDLLEPQESLCSGGEEQGPLNVKRALSRIGARTWKAGNSK